MSADTEDRGDETFDYFEDLDKHIKSVSSVEGVPQEFKELASEILRQCSTPGDVKDFTILVWIAIASLLFEVFKWLMDRKAGQWALHRACNHPQGLIAGTLRERLRGWLPDEAKDSQIPDKMMVELNRRVLAHQAKSAPEAPKKPPNKKKEGKNG